MSALEEARKTHPNLANSVVEKYNEYFQASNEHSIVNKWLVEIYGGIGQFDKLSDAVLTDSDVLGLPDQRCIALYPVLYDGQVPQVFVPNGGKAKVGRGAEAIPSTIARLSDDTLIFAEWLGQGYTLEVIEASRVCSATSIHIASGFMSKVPAVQFSVRDNKGRLGIY